MSFEDKKILLDIVDRCAQESFRKGIQRRKVEVYPLRRVGEIDNLTTVEDIENTHLSEDYDGRKVPFGRSNATWVELKSFMRNDDEVYYFSSFVPDTLIGSSGVELVRDGYVIGTIDVMIA